MTAAEFRELMDRVARGWSEQDTELALSCFAEDAVCMEPPDAQLFVGHEQLRAREPGTYMRFPVVLFDEASQVGAAEYAFGDEGSEIADHGVAVVEVQDGRIPRWREYQRKGPASFDDFLAVEGKSWQWHIGSYP